MDSEDTRVSSYLLSANRNWAVNFSICLEKLLLSYMIEPICIITDVITYMMSELCCIVSSMYIKITDVIFLQY